MEVDVSNIDDKKKIFLINKWIMDVIYQNFIGLLICRFISLLISCPVIGLLISWRFIGLLISCRFVGLLISCRFIG